MEHHSAIRRTLSAFMAAAMLMTSVQPYTFASESAAEEMTEAFEAGQGESALPDNISAGKAASQEAGQAEEDMPVFADEDAEDVMPEINEIPDDIEAASPAGGYLLEDDDIPLIEDLDGQMPEDDEGIYTTGAYEETSLPNILEYENYEQERVENEESLRMKVSICKEISFPEGSQAWIEQLYGEGLSEVSDSLADFLAGYDFAVILPVDICVKDLEGEEIEDIGRTTVRLYLEDTDILDDTILCHQMRDGQWEKIDFTQADEEEVPEPYVEFTTDTFSPFIFAGVEEHQDITETGGEQETAGEETENTMEEPATEEQAEEADESTSEDSSEAGTENAAEEETEELTEAFTEEASISEEGLDGQEDAASLDVLEELNEAIGENVGLLGAYASKLIVLNVVDRDGNLVSASDIGDGFDLLYYERPASSGGTSEEDLQTIHIDSPSTTLRVNMESGATADDPYELYFIGDTRDPINTRYLCDSYVMYDGTDIISAYSQSGGGSIDVSGSEVTLNVYKTTMVTPQVKVNLHDLYEGVDAYPAQVSVEISSFFSYYMTQNAAPPIQASVTAQEDGTATIVFQDQIASSQDIARFAPNTPYAYAPVSIRLKTNEETGKWRCDTPLTSMGQEQESTDTTIYTFLAAFDDNGNIHLVNTTGSFSPGEEEFIPDFSYVKGNPLRVHINVVDDEGNPVDASDITPYPMPLQDYPSGSYGGRSLTLQVTQPSETFTVEKNPAASASAPYVLSFSGRVPIYGRVAEYYVPPINVTYDDTQIVSAVDQSTGQAVPFGNNEITVTIVKLSTAAPKLKIQFDADEQEMYPTQVTANLSYGGVYETLHGQISEDGILELDANSLFPVGSTSLLQVSLNFSESNADYNWKWQNYPSGGQGYKNNNTCTFCLDKDGFLHAANFDSGAPVVSDEKYTFQYKARPLNEVDPKIRVRLYDPDGLSGESTWPAYVQTIISDTPTTAVAHTSNINDSGYASALVPYGTETRTVTIPGASKVKVDIWYRTYRNDPYMFISILDRSRNLTFDNAYSHSVSGRLGGGGSYGEGVKQQSSATKKTFILDGNTARFYYYNYYSSSSSYRGGYGYYATVTGLDENGDPLEQTTYYNNVTPVSHDDVGAYVTLDGIDSLPRKNEYRVTVIPYEESSCNTQNTDWEAYSDSVSSSGIEDLSVTLPYTKVALPLNLITDSNVGSSYPVYIKATARGYNGGYYEDTKVVGYTENSSVPIRFIIPRPNSYTSVGDISIELTAYKDAACTEPYDKWINGSRTIQAGYNGNYFTTYDDNSNTVQLTDYTLKVRGTDRITVPVTAAVSDESILAGQFPVLMEAVLSPGQTIRRVISSAADLDEDLVFTAAGDFFSTNDSYSLDVNFYKYNGEDVDTFDTGSAQACVNIGSYSASGLSMTEDYSLVDPYYNNSPVALYYAQLSVKVKPQPYHDVIDEQHPVRFEMLVSYYYGDDIPAAEVTRTDSDEFTYVTDILLPQNMYVQAVVSANPDDVENTWYPGNASGNIQQNGSINDTALPYESDGRTSVDVNIPVKLNIPEGVEHPYYYVSNGSSSTEYVHVMVLKKEPNDTFSAVSHSVYGSYDSFASSPNSYSYTYCWTDVADLSSEDHTGNVSVGTLKTGTYYVISFIDNGSSSFSMGGTNEHFDPQWVQNMAPAKVTVQEDGSVVDEDGSPYVAEFEFIQEYYDGDKPLVNPVLDIETTLPENYNYLYQANSDNLYTPVGYHVELTPTWEHYSDKFRYHRFLNFRDANNRQAYQNTGYQKYQLIPQGRSVLGTPEETYRWYTWLASNPSSSSGVDISGYEGTPNVGYIASQVGGAYLHGQRFYNSGAYVYDEVLGMPVGDYTLRYYLYDYDYNGYSRRWHTDTLQVHLADDGHYYKINDDGSYDTEPYIVEFRMLTDDERRGEDASFDSLDVSVMTYAHEGVSLEGAFKEGESFKVSLVERDAVDNTEKTIAQGSVHLTETGESVITLLPTGEAEKITVWRNNTYHFTYDTEDADGVVNRDWLSRETYINLEKQGTLEEDFLNAVPIQLLNEYLVLPWKTVSPQKAVRTSGENTITFKPVESTSQIEEKSNYIIAAYNNYDGCLYALAYDEQGGHQIKLLEASEYTAARASGKLEYIVSETDNTSNYVMQANKVKLAEGSVSLQFKTALKNSAGKSIAVKLGQSSSILNPLFDGSAGTLTVYEDGLLDEQLSVNGFSVWKGRYARLQYMPEMFGYSGFSVQGLYNGSHGNWPTVFPDIQFTGDNRIAYVRNPDVLVRDSQPYIGYFEGAYSYYGGHELYSSDYAYTGEAPERYYRFDIPAAYLTDGYVSTLSGRYNPNMPVYTSFILLSDNIPEEIEEPDLTNDYTLVKTFGDFLQTFVSNSKDTYATNMVLVWTDENGKEWALNPNGLKQTKSEPLAADYRKVSVGADCELIPDNNSGTSSTFGFYPTDVDGTLEMVFTNQYAFRKSRQNNNETKEYVTLTGNDGDSAWTKADDAAHGSGLVYVLRPTNAVRSESDYDTPQEYTLQVIRNGEVSFLGVAEDNAGKQQMVTVKSQEDAIRFKIYTDNPRRYYSSAYGSDLYRYYRVTSLEDINALDEILIVYNDGEKRHIVSGALYDSGRLQFSGNTYDDVYLSASAEVLPEYSTVDSRDDEYPDNAAYKWRFETEEYVKKPFAYMDPDDEGVIWAQGIAANAIGKAKKESSSQRKYEDVTALANGGGNYLYIKAGNPTTYYYKAAETNFFKSDAPLEFYIRGGKSDAWLGLATYSKPYLNLTTGAYTYSNDKITFNTVTTAGRTSFEIYRRSTTNDTFTVAYHTVEKELDKTEIKPKESFVLTQKMDEKVGEQDYIFVGWTADPDKAGYLSLADSANLFDFDDHANKAAVKEEVKERHSLLGNCAPEGTNRIDYADVESLLDDHGVLNVYPVYAVKGYSSAISANEGSQMIIGASDFKDLQVSGDGTISSAERWLGSINIEVYKDGVLWVPGAGGSTIGLKKAAGTPSTATLYFAYHNDNAADLNIKFIADDVTADTLYAYMSSSDFSQGEPSANYIIDAVYAEQGGSEDGLKYRYNWMDKEHGGQLDNVKGGSTVKIYVTTKYQVKYYLDNDGTGFKELTGDSWQDDGYYTTSGTENAVAAYDSIVDYKVKSGNAYTQLIDRTPDISTTFKDEDISRGEYQHFIYLFDTYDHDFDVAPLPGEDIIGAGVALKENKWALRNASLEKQMEVDPESVWTMSGTTYGTGNTVYSFVGTQPPFTGDTVNTYHLTLRVVSDVSVEKAVDSEVPADLQKDFSFTMTLTDTVHENEADKIVVNGTYGDMTFTNNVATFTLKHGQKKTAECLPAGLSYSVTEAPAEGYRLKASANTAGTVVLGETQEASFVNEPNRTHNITVTKTVSGNMGNKDEDFELTIDFTGSSAPSSLPYSVTEEEATVSAGTLTAVSGKVTFTLRHGQTITISEVPDGVGYVVKETLADKNGYTTTVTAAHGTAGADKSVTGTLADDESISYSNARNMVVPTLVQPGSRYITWLLLAICMGAFLYVLTRRRKRLKYRN